MEKTYFQIYYEKNKEKHLKYIKEKTKCECGKIVQRLYMSKHKKTKNHENNMRHLQFLNND